MHNPRDSCTFFRDNPQPLKGTFPVIITIKYLYTNKKRGERHVFQTQQVLFALFAGLCRGFGG
jgi:hypothetical protein